MKLRTEYLILEIQKALQDEDDQPELAKNIIDATSDYRCRAYSRKALEKAQVEDERNTPDL